MRLQNSQRETAARHLVKRIPTGNPDETVASVLARLPGNVVDHADTVYVVDEINTLIGMVPMPRWLAAAPHQYLHDILRKPFPTVHTGADQETVASLAIVNGIAAVPVVDDQQHLLGVVPPQALLEVLRHEHVEDLHRFVGIRHYTLQARTAMEAPPIRRARPAALAVVRADGRHAGHLRDDAIRKRAAVPGRDRVLRSGPCLPG